MDGLAATLLLIAAAQGAGQARAEILPGARVTPRLQLPQTGRQRHHYRLTMPLAANGRVLVVFE